MSLFRWSARRQLPVPLTIAISVLLLAEQIVLTPPIVLDRRAEMRFLASLPPAPAECHVFYAATGKAPASADPAVNEFYSGNAAAMLVATYDNLPTINGRSSVVPRDWNFSYPGSGDYPVRVIRYAAEHHLSRLCGLDFEERRWLPPAAE